MILRPAFALSILASVACPGALACQGPDPVADGVELERVWPRLRFERPVLLRGAGDGSGRVFVVEQAGVVRVFEAEEDPREARVFLDISERVSRRGNEEGLIGLAFHPDFAENGEVYAHYSLAGREARGVLSRFTLAEDDPAVLDPASEEVLLTQDQPWRNHNGGSIEFGPDGYLYLSFGDGGSADDPQGNGQKLETWLGAILRLDVDTGDRAVPYAIPTDNPFVHHEGARPEIWAYGFRNVWRFSFDRETGELWAADVGQNSVEEVDLVVPGGNYGWRRFEALELFDGDTPLTTEPAVEPVGTYGRGEGISVTGGYVYRGARHPALWGDYLFGDYASGNLWRLRRAEDGGYEQDLVCRSGRSIASFGEDDDGELYVCSFDGRIYRIIPADGPGASYANWPETLAETGLMGFDERAVPAEGLVAYEVNAPFWSDGAAKERWIDLPEGGALGYRDRGAFEVPVGTTLVKHFRGSTGRRKRDLETRLIRRVDKGWEAATYVWEGREAHLAPAGRQFELWTREGVHTWHAPSASECASCHVRATGFVLGLTAAQLNRGDQLERLARAGLLELPEGFTPDGAPRFPRLDDGDAPLADRARAWLDVNCAMCHQPDGPGNATIDLRHHVPLEATGLVDAAPAQGELGLRDPRQLAPGDPGRSMLLHRVRTLGAGRMPPIGSLRVDEDAVALIEAWIESL